jgi:hypothetical protein
MKPKATASGDARWGLNEGINTNASSVDNDANYTITHINFAHYGSQFLEETMKDYIIDDSDKNMNLASRTSDDNRTVCYIEEPASNADGVPSDGAAVASDIKSLMDSGCRWVDYVETNADTITRFRGTDGGTFRLAFK